MRRKIVTDGTLLDSASYRNARRIAGLVIVLVAIVAAAVFVHRYATQVELRFINDSGRNLSDIQVYHSPNRFYLGSLDYGDERVVTIPAYNSGGYRLSFVPEKLDRRYFVCPEYLHPGAHVEWTVKRSGAVVGKVAWLPGIWQADSRAFSHARGLKD
ncbi:MAG: restriction endonuclease, SacI family [Capsulimonadaceae bacterium]|nr:restriction endonuclease, SacI family [Capsulimonadaceae bacterium]